MAAKGSKEPMVLKTALMGERVLKLAMDGMGWHFMRLLHFEMEIYPESMIGKGRFVVNEYSCQPFGYLHAGTTATLAEAIASLMASYASQFQPVAGVELNVNHLRPVQVGRAVLLTATSLLLGKRFQVWDMRFETERPKPVGIDSRTSELVLVAVARVSAMIIPDSRFAPIQEVPDAFGGVTFTKTWKSRTKQLRC
ncbi:unnamed protein product [Calypogeia fissa]